MNISWQDSCYCLVFSGIFSLNATSLVIQWAYQHYILVVKVKNSTSAKVTLLSFNRTDVFLYDVMVSEDHVLEAKWCSWCVCVGNLVLSL